MYRSYYNSLPRYIIRRDCSYYLQITSFYIIYCISSVGNYNYVSCFEQCDFCFKYACLDVCYCYCLITILLSLNFDPLAPRCFICFRGNIYTAIIGRTCYSCKPFVTSIKVWKVQYYTIITRRIFGICSIRSNF